MRFANFDGRLTLIQGDPDAPLDGAPGIDVNAASGGRIPAAPAAAFERWPEVVEWARDPGPPSTVLRTAAITAPSPSPRQIFGVGLNYADHGAESGMELVSQPLVFTKLTTAVTGPFGEIELTTQAVDWEVEIAVVIGRAARHVAAADAWDYIAGLTVGQDLSDRDIQWRPASAPQFSLGKSLQGFAPLGPVLVTPDEYDDPNDIELACFLNREQVQQSRSSLMLFSVGELIEYLSGITMLLPGDVIFTGTPSGVGMARTPPRYLVPGDTLESYVEGVGTMVHNFSGLAAEPPAGDHAGAGVL